MSTATLLLTGAELRELLPVPDCIAAVEHAFSLAGTGAPTPAQVLGVSVPHGGFHVKAVALQLERHYLAAKLNGNFPGNPKAHGLPTIQGVVALCDADDGRLLALLDSIELTRIRTGAATAVAAKYLARPESKTLMVIGCGTQGRAQVECLAAVLPLERVLLYDEDGSAAASLADWIAGYLPCSAEVVPAAEVRRHARASDAIVTCTPSRRPVLTPDDVAAGTFVAGVGADASDKQELSPELLATGLLVVDVLEQCATFGDLHHALAAGILTRDAVHAELAQVVAGTRSGRGDPEQITIFDSTGTALEDVAAAALTYERALRSRRGLAFQFA